MSSKISSISFTNLSTAVENGRGFSCGVKSLNRQLYAWDPLTFPRVYLSFDVPPWVLPVKFDIPPEKLKKERTCLFATIYSMTHNFICYLYCWVITISTAFTADNSLLNLLSTAKSTSFHLLSTADDSLLSTADSSLLHILMITHHFICYPYYWVITTSSAIYCWYHTTSFAIYCW